jgi:hypothetical protein
MTARQVVVVVLALAALPRMAIAGPLAFAVQPEGETLRQYRFDASTRIADDLLDATVTMVGLDEWELDLTPKRVAISRVWFPWEPEQTTSVPDLDAAIVYYPRLLGVAVKASLLTEWGWQGGPYPGECYAPLTVVADPTAARMVAATNWPPRRVTPMYSLGRIGLRYDEHLGVGARSSYRALIVQTGGWRGAQPWQTALDRYKDWLQARVREAGLLPSHPLWIREIHGWLNLQLQNMAMWDAARVKAVWARWKQQLPWIQFWGQMSAYYQRDLTFPEETGCCLDKSAMHARYKPELPRLAAAIAREGRVGFYARPMSHSPPLVEPVGSSPTPAYAFLRDWLERNRSEYGANAFYIDVLGGRDFGDPYHLATLLKESVDSGTVIERTVDVYPTAALMSGALGGGIWQGGPGRTNPDLHGGLTRTTFPAFGRYLLSDRIIFLGESNGDGRWWGPKADYWTERQAFLLGAKFDVVHPTENGLPDGPEDRALALAIAARDRAGWWRRNPEYLDRRGLGRVPDEIDVRRYRGRDGEHLLVVDNWSRKQGLRIEVDGRPVDLPGDALSVVVLPTSSSG